MERLTRNPEKLASAGSRCGKDTLGRKKSFGTHRPPYSTRRKLVITWQETKKLLHDDGFESRGSQRKTWMGNVREDLKEKNIDLTRIGEATRNREVWRSLARASSSASG